MVLSSLTANCIVLYYSEEYLELLIRGLQALLPDSLHLDEAIREALEEGRKSFHSMGQEGKY